MYVVDFQDPSKVELNIGTDFMSRLTELSQPEFGYAGLLDIALEIVPLHS